jgi:DNA topoisomerase VI subunit A
MNIRNRTLVKKLGEDLNIPLYGLFDCDAYGVGILVIDIEYIMRPFNVPDR